MGRYHYGGKTEADGLKKITVFKLKEWGYLGDKWYGTIVWTSNWSESKSSVTIQSNVSGDEKYLRIIYTQTDFSTDEKTDFDYKIPFVTTKCHLGGKRYWFVCPWYANGVYCGRRVGVLYLGGQRFACRHCYDLSYASKNENRKHYMFSFGQVLDLENKIEKFEKKVTTQFYKGRPTRKYRRLLDLKRQYYGIDLEPTLAKMENRLQS